MPATINPLHHALEQAVAAAPAGPARAFLEALLEHGEDSFSPAAEKAMHPKVVAAISACDDLPTLLRWRDLIAQRLAAMQPPAA